MTPTDLLDDKRHPQRAGHGEHSSNHREEHAGHTDHSDHESLFRRRFWICLILSALVLIYSPTIQNWLGFSAPAFPGDQWITPLFAFIVFLVGGLPFIKMAVPELRKRQVMHHIGSPLQFDWRGADASGPGRAPSKGRIGGRNNPILIHRDL